MAGALRDSPQEMHLSPLGLETASWVPALVPGTVAATHRANGVLPELDRVENYDASDWWYCCQFGASPLGDHETAVLLFEGLATLADIWLNGELVATSANMFREVEVDVTTRLQGTNDLCIRFRSLHADLMQRRSRPRWRTSMVEQQQLRWFRTTLLGRMPGWCPPVRPVGPWRPSLARAAAPGELPRGRCDPFLGIAMVHACPWTSWREHLPDARITGASLEVMGTRARPSSVCRRCRQLPHHGSDNSGAEAWWPHTHGPQPRYPAAIHLTTTAGAQCESPGQAGVPVHSCRHDDDGFGLSVNGVPIFCRGACWSTPDIVSLRPSAG